MSDNNTFTRKYITGLDGIRTIAVLAVIFYHLLPTKISGGYLGVPIFFVLTGYLLTDRLMFEGAQTGTIKLKDFYSSRIKRLYPSLIAALLLSCAYITLFQRDLLNNLRQSVVSSLLQINNWWQISNGLSYFDRFNTESPFTHIWALSVEGQNYIILPLLIFLFMRIFRKRKQAFYFFLIASIASAIWMAILYVPGQDPTRVYYGTDTRIFSIWLGSALAIIFPTLKTKGKVLKKYRNILDGLGLVSWILIFLAFLFLDAHFHFIYYGGLFLISVLSVFLVTITALPNSRWNKVLTNPIFAWFGKRSYGIYLYQFPVMIFYEAKQSDINTNILLHAIIKLCLILILAELSYRFIEEPTRNMKFKKFLHSLRQMSTVQKGFFAGSAAVFIIALIGIIIAPTNYKSEEQIKLEKQIEQNEQKLKQQNSKILAPIQDVIQTYQDANNAATDNPGLTEISETYNLTVEQIQIAREMEVTMFGDSVLLAAADRLQKIFPKAVIDGAVFREIKDGDDIATNLIDNGKMKDVVVIVLGSNGMFFGTQFEDIMNLLGDRRVFWVNMQSPTSYWQEDLNNGLNEKEKEYTNLTIVDWHSFSLEHGDWFYPDEVHPNEQGSIMYASLIGNILTK